jgi:hypothetical protein
MCVALKENAFTGYKFVYYIEYTRLVVTYTFVYFASMLASTHYSCNRKQGHSMLYNFTFSSL